MMMPRAWHVRPPFPSDGGCVYLCHVTKKKREKQLPVVLLFVLYVYTFFSSMCIYSEVQGMLRVSRVLAT